MSFLTARLGLIVDTTADPFLTSEVAGNWEIIDEYPGIFTGSTSTITSEVSAWGSAQAGQVVSDTTTGLLWQWNGTTLVRFYGTGMLSTVKVTSPVTVTTVLSSTTTVITTTCTIPTGSRWIEIQAEMTDVANVSQDTTIFLLEDSTVIQSAVVQANLLIPVTLYTTRQPTAASHTYSVTAGVASASTTTFDASATAPIVLSVKES